MSMTPMLALNHLVNPHKNPHKTHYSPHAADEDKAQKDEVTGPDHAARWWQCQDGHKGSPGDLTLSLAWPLGALSGSSTSQSLHFPTHGMGTGCATSETCWEDATGTCGKCCTRDMLSPPHPGGANSHRRACSAPHRAAQDTQAPIVLDTQDPRGLRASGPCRPHSARTLSGLRGARPGQQHH